MLRIYAADHTLIAPSLPPVKSSNPPGSAPRVMIDDSTIPECAFHEAVQSNVSEYLCNKVGTSQCRARNELP
jgi:hypothetical protein